MLNPQVAEERLREFTTDNPLGKQRERFAKLPEASRVAAFALTGYKPDGTAYVTTQDWREAHKQREAQQKAQQAAFVLLDKLPIAERETLFAAFFPQLASLLARWWKPDGPTLYQGSYNRRPFRISRAIDADETRHERQAVWNQLFNNINLYQEMPIQWFAAWAPYLGAYNADTFGRLFAAAIDGGTPEGDAVFNILIESARGDHEIGAMGRHVVRGLLSSSRTEGWEYIEKLLLAAQRQEGLRQSILEVIDESNPQAFRRMLKLIRENDLFRFSATVRAADTWFGMNWVAYEKLSVKQANAAAETVETFLADPAGRDEVLATTTDGQTVYLALWSIAFDDAYAAIRAAVPLLSDSQIERRYAALHLLTELRLTESKAAILSAFDDPDLRVAQKAFAATNWYEGGVVSNGAEMLAALLAAQGDLAVQATETVTAENTGLAAVFAHFQENISHWIAMAQGKTAAESEIAAETAANQKGDDRFERLERNIPRFPARAKELEPVIWDWDKLTAHAEPLADALPRVINDRPFERLYPYIPLMGSWGRRTVAEKIGKAKEQTAERREALLKLAADNAADVRNQAFEGLKKYSLPDEDAEQIESLLTRKAADLRKSALSLLLNRTDEKALESGERLTAAGNINQRVAGLDLLTQMVEKKRSPEKARGIVVKFTAARGEKITDAEKAMVEPLTDEQHEKPTLDNALGLMNRTKLTRGTAPEMPTIVPQFVSISVLEIMQALDKLVEKHKEDSVVIENYNGDKEDVLLGNVNWRFPSPNPQKPWEEDVERLPLREVWEEFWDNRPDSMRDVDGLELYRTVTLGDTPGFVHRTMSIKELPEVIKEQLAPFHEQRDKLKIQYGNIVPRIAAWLLQREATTVYTPRLTTLLLDAAEASLAIAYASPSTDKEAKESKDWRDDNRATLWLQQARQHVRSFPQLWTAEQQKRLLSLIIWMEHPQNMSRKFVSDLGEYTTAFQMGMLNENDIYEKLLGPRLATGYWQGVFNDLGTLSSRKGSTYFEKTPGLREIVDKCRKRIIEIELRRGDTETAASAPARSLRYSGGQDVLLKLVAALGKDTFARGYSYYGQTNRSNVFSYLIRATFPGEIDTPESFAAAAKAAKISDKRLIETAMYAPQWARHVEATLGWDGFTQAVWWLHAHTKDNSWSVDAEIREAWTAEIADKTPLSAADLTEGAVDVAWFQRVHEQLGEDRWAQVDDAAKYASSAGGHKRAQLFADAMLNRLDLSELLTRIQEKRHQDSLRALGLLPLPQSDPEAREADLLRRYKTMQEFLRTSKQFGAQRQESEKLATRIGMENLARTAGYPDPIRLTWAMEAAAVADLKEGAVTKTVGEVSVSLAINGLGMPELTVEKKGKSLANIPPLVKKEPEVAELVARKTDITRQVSRMRESLEGAMCRGDLFTGTELATLLEHPILKPLLRNLVFIEAEGKEPVLGYPIGDNRLEDCDGAMFTLNPDTALRIAHPYDLLHTGKWEHWQKDCFLRERVQPFKQVFRELYVLTDAETADGTKSQRYTGHQVNPKQALALFNKRGWVGGGDYDYESDGPRKTFHEAGYTVSVGFMGWTATPADVEGSTIHEIRFTKKGDWKPVPLNTVPPRIFSEAMRDLDLVVSVAHVGGVDPEASQSTVEMRAALVREAMTMLKITNVRFQKSHAIIDGTLATYNVHLGSAVVHRQPGGYLCIVPVHSQHRGRLFLPFVDDDPRTAEVLSKVLLLAKDSEIKDPTILEQILAVR